MLTLLLMRHAKSSWDVPSLSDHARPLNPRGRAAAPRMARWLASQNKRFDAVLSSTAARAVQTASSVVEVFKFPGMVESSKRLYLASAEEIVDCIAELSDTHRAVLVIGHNPGMEQLVSHWAMRAEPFPTAAVAEIELPLNEWKELSIRAQAQVRGIWRPRELPTKHR